jgi:hypothetical protein
MTLVASFGYTGTRDGMARPQMISAYRLAAHEILVRDSEYGQFDVHFGDCEGGDAEFFVIATVLGCRTIAHPPASPARRAWCKADIILEPRDYLARDYDIATEATAGLIAAPASQVPVFRGPGSGTWTTVRYGLELGRPVLVVMPDGLVVPGDAFRSAFGLAVIS